MSAEGQEGGGDIAENPEPEADSELSGIGDNEYGAGANGHEQPEDECDVRACPEAGTDLDQEKDDPEAVAADVRLQPCEDDQLAELKEDDEDVASIESSELHNVNSETTKQDENSRNVIGTKSDFPNNELVDVEQSSQDQQDQLGCVEGEEAEGIVPCVNSSSESENPSPEHERLCSGRTSQSDEAESDSFSAEATSESASSTQHCSGQDIVSNGNSNATIDIKQPDEKGTPSVDQVVNSSECEHLVVQVSATTEDESLERIENGQVPECDRDFILKADSEAAHPIDQHVECLEDNISDDHGENVNDSPECQSVHDKHEVESDIVNNASRLKADNNVQQLVDNLLHDSPESAQLVPVLDKMEDSNSASGDSSAHSISNNEMVQEQQIVESMDQTQRSASSEEPESTFPNNSKNDFSKDAIPGQGQRNPENLEEVEEGIELSEDYLETEPQNVYSSICEEKPHSVSQCAVPKHSPSQSANAVDSKKTSPKYSKDVTSPQASPKSMPAVSSAKGSPKAVRELLDFDDGLLSELDEALHSERVRSEPTEPTESQLTELPGQVESHEESNDSCALPNGLNLEGLADSPHLKPIMDQLMRMQQQVQDSQKKLNRLNTEKQQQAAALATTVKERDVYQAQVQSLRSRCPDDLYIPQIKELEYTIAQQQNEMRGLKDKLSQHDSAAKRAVSTLQNELKVRVDQVTKMYEECVREKDGMVIKYAESEQKNIACQKAVEKMEAKVRESAKDRESMVAKVKAVKAEKNKAVADMDAKSNEMGHAVKEIEKMREMLQSADVRIKWSQNKLKAELEAHKDTKASLEKTNIKLKEAREETQMIRRDCQAMIKTYQESEEIKSNSLDKELKVKETELIIQRQERSDREELYQMTAKEMESLKIKHKDSLEELITLRDKVRCMEEEIEVKEQSLSRTQEKMEKQGEENKHLHDKAGTLDQLQDDFNRAQTMIQTLDRDIQDLMVSNKDLQQDMEGCRRRESELLDLTEKLSRKNAKLQSDNTNMNNQVVTLSSEAEKWKMEIQELDTMCRNLEDSLKTERKERKEETESLRSQLEESTKHMENYRQQMEDEKDLNRTLKRKHVNNVKDLTRQLQQARKRLETLENHTERDTTSMGSRTSSNGSLNTLGENTAPQNNTNSNHNPHANSRAPSQEQEYPVITEQVEVDKQVLIERIVRLQKAHARKNEKLEFLDDHIHQLVDEIQKKNRIIQNYVMREEAGTLAPEYMDENKLRVRTEAQALLAKKGGIMASVYSTHQQDGAMTLDLSLEINKKLQSVLEDTLLKNITLKESLDTLGTEIARLSQENRQLQLKIQELPH